MPRTATEVGKGQPRTKLPTGPAAFAAPLGDAREGTRLVPGDVPAGGRWRPPSPRRSAAPAARCRGSWHGAVLTKTSIWEGRHASLIQGNEFVGSRAMFWASLPTKGDRHDLDVFPLAWRDAPRGNLAADRRPARASADEHHHPLQGS